MNTSRSYPGNEEGVVDKQRHHSTNRAAINDAEQGASVLDVLIKARALIEKRENWAGRGDLIKPGVRECALTASYAAAPNRESRELAQCALRVFTGGQFITVFNDTHTHAEVIALFDRAIEAEKAAGGQ